MAGNTSNKWLNIIQDEQGNVSMIRIMGVIFAISFVVQWQRSVWLGVDGPGIEELIATLGAFGFKVLQKPFEKKTP